jgi:hypothetical protein
MSDETMPILRFQNGSQWASLYYYQGNFFYPVFLATKNLERLVNLRIKRFIAANNDLVLADQSHPDYRNKFQLAEAQGL